MVATTESSAKYRSLSSPEEILADHEDQEVNMDESLAAQDPGLSDHSVDTRVRWTYFLLGCAILLPWNALIIATPFFLSRLVGSSIYATFSSYESSVFTAANLLFQAYCTATSKQASPSRRVFGSIVVLIFSTSLLFISTFIRATPSIFAAFILLSAVCFAASSAYISTSVYAGAALLGPSYLQSMMSGQAAIAFGLSAVQVAGSAVSVWGATPESIAYFVAHGDAGDGRAEEVAARIFFGISTAFLALTFVSYAWLTRQPIYKSAVGVLERTHKVAVVQEEDDEELRGLMSDGPSSASLDSRTHIYRVCKENFIFMFSVAYVFSVTLAIFPAITVTVQPTNPNVHPLLFTAVHFLAFNVGDFFGRYSCSFPRLVIWSAHKILVISLLRTLFIPIFLLCNVQRPSGTLPIPPLISSDVLYMLILLALGLSNGYTSVLCMLAAPSLEHNPRLKGRREDVDLAATLAGFFLIVGLAVGAFLSFGVRASICDCNPFKM
ncbi:nucleoside transporter-domain-containing protein [Phlebopus sp. FC_14]|nr:nucleoside transporter-domain-containing protein [Phlebopus sp. FC_14]